MTNKRRYKQMYCKKVLITIANIIVSKIVNFILNILVKNNKIYNINKFHFKYNLTFKKFIIAHGAEKHLVLFEFQKLYDALTFCDKSNLRNWARD